MDLKAFVAGEIPVVEGRGFAWILRKTAPQAIDCRRRGLRSWRRLRMAMCCDLIVAADDAHFGIPEVKRGLVAGAGGLLRLPRQIPFRVAMEFALTGEFFSARRAYELGFVNRLAEHGSALEVAKQLAAAIASNGPLAVAISKQILQASRNWSTDEMFAGNIPIFGRSSIARMPLRAPKRLPRSALRHGKANRSPEQLTGFSYRSSPGCTKPRNCPTLGSPG